MKEWITISPGLEFLRETLIQRWQEHNRKPEGKLELYIDETLPANSFLLEKSPSGVLRVGAGSRIDLFCGAGTILHGDLRSPGIHFMQKPFRAVYFATHFDNYYCTAPKAELEAYIADLALWGFNTLVFWHDMHHYESWNDPKAKAHREHLFFLAECARKCGMKIASLHLANEGPMDLDPSLRAYRKPGIYSRGGWYDSQICPSREEGMGELEKHFDTVIRDFLLPLQPDHVILWPYDQGGCQCEKCSPWGGNGFLRASRVFAGRLQKVLPSCGIILSTWFMDEEEVRRLVEGIREGKIPCDLLTIEQVHRAGDKLLPEPEDIAVIGFPDIAMRMNPWGGYGMDPQPGSLQEEWDDCKERRCGGYLYSEGIFDDINKVIYSQFYCWDRPALETLQLYGAYECGKKFAEPFVRMVLGLERNSFAARCVPVETMRMIQSKLFCAHPEPTFDQLIHILEEHGQNGCWQYVMRKKGNDFLFHDAWVPSRICDVIEHFLPEKIKCSPRWRILRTRAALDAVMAENGGVLSPRTWPLLKTLEKYYYVTGETIRDLRPPVVEREEKIHTKGSLAKDLERLGIAHSDVLFVHSSYKALGNIEGGPETVLDVLTEYLIPHGGQLFFPAFTYLLDKDEVFSVKDTPCLTGILPELFRKRPGVVRSLDPTHSIAALGKDAEELLKGCEEARTPFGPGTPWEKLKGKGVKILFLGTGLACNTFLHYEDELQAPFSAIYTDTLEDRKVLDEKGRLYHVLRHPMYAPRSDYFAKMRGVFRENGVLSSGTFGDGEADLLDAVKMGEVVGPLIRKDPAVFTRDEM